MRRPLIAGNWKMNGSRQWANDLSRALRAGSEKLTHCDLAVFPPAIYLAEVAQCLVGSTISWGGQTLCEFSDGAYTGEISASMLTDLGCQMVLIGHSERRQIFGETDEQLTAKYQAACAAGLKPVFCVGETLEQRESNVTRAVIEAQLQPLLNSTKPANLAATVIAYEPVWAIGTGKTASPDQAQEVHAFIRSKFAEVDATIAASLRIVYGGSVKPDGARELLQMPDIDGGLIGGASLNADQFLAIAQRAE